MLVPPPRAQDLAQHIIGAAWFNKTLRGRSFTVAALIHEGTAVPASRPPQPPRRWTQEEMQAGYEDTDIP